MKDKVAVVVTCFNYGAYLGEAIGSLRRQRGGPPRMIVVDDGSTDVRTISALNELDSAGDVIVVRQANQGVCAARNAGLALGERPFMLCLDADDRLAEGALQSLLGPLEAHPALGFTYGHQRFFGDLEGVMRLPPYDPLRLLDRHLIGPTALVRREVVHATGGYDSAFSAYEDWEFWVHALHHGWTGLRVDTVTHEYRRHGRGKLIGDRRQYRRFRRQLKDKHRVVFDNRKKLADSSEMGVLNRGLYRWFWGPRPIPRPLEAAAERALWPSGA